MRKRLKSTTISVSPDTGTVRKVKSRTVRAGGRSITTKMESVQAFAESKPFDQEEIKAASRTLKQFHRVPGWSWMKSFWVGASGQFSKRAFFFSLFAFISVTYIVLSIIGLVTFDEKLGLFIFGSNAAFGINYYKNERDKDSNGGSVNDGKPVII